MNGKNSLILTRWTKMWSYFEQSQTQRGPLAVFQAVVTNFASLFTLLLVGFTQIFNYDVVFFFFMHICVALESCISLVILSRWKSGCRYDKDATVFLFFMF